MHNSAQYLAPKIIKGVIAKVTNVNRHEAIKATTGPTIKALIEETIIPMQSAVNPLK